MRYVRKSDYSHLKKSPHRIYRWPTEGGWRFFLFLEIGSFCPKAFPDREESNICKGNLGDKIIIQFHYLITLTTEKSSSESSPYTLFFFLNHFPLALSSVKTQISWSPSSEQSFMSMKSWNKAHLHLLLLDYFRYIFYLLLKVSLIIRCFIHKSQSHIC